MLLIFSSSEYLQRDNAYVTYLFLRHILESGFEDKLRDIWWKLKISRAVWVIQLAISPEKSVVLPKFLEYVLMWYMKFLNEKPFQRMITAIAMPTIFHEYSHVNLNIWYSKTLLTVVEIGRRIRSSYPAIHFKNPAVSLFWTTGLCMPCNLFKDLLNKDISLKVKEGKISTIRIDKIKFSCQFSWVLLMELRCLISKNQHVLVYSWIITLKPS